MLENPELLGQMIARTGAHSTNLEGEESPELLCSRCKAYADAWRPRAEQIWERDGRPITFSR